MTAILDAISFARFYARFSKIAKRHNIQIVISDNSKIFFFRVMHAILGGSNVLHLCNSRAFSLFANKKCQNIKIALDYAQSDKIILLDDDVRPTCSTLSEIARQLDCHGVVRTMIKYDDPDIFDRIEMSGIHVINATTLEKQFWGNIAFRTTFVGVEDFQGANRLGDSLFDELAIERRALARGASFYYIETSQLTMIRSGRTIRQFLEQRLRYAYENLAFPTRTVLYASLLPSVLLVAGLGSPALSVMLLFAILGSVTEIARREERRNRSGHTSRSWGFAAIWFLPYFVTTWIALLLRLSGGYRWGNSLILRAA